MARVTDGIPINNELLDRRVKLTRKDKEDIRELYSLGGISQRELASAYGVSRRLIQFAISPESYEKSKAQFRERRKDGRYSNTEHDKKRQVEASKGYVEYKKELYKKGLIG